MSSLFRKRSLEVKSQAVKTTVLISHYLLIIRLQDASFLTSHVADLQYNTFNNQSFLLMSSL